MSDKPNHYILAMESEAKFEQYMVALTFTILGAAINTGHFGASIVAGSLELLAWAALFLSGFAGLALWSKTPGLHQRLGLYQDTEETALALGEALWQKKTTAVSLLGGVVDVQKEFHEGKNRLAGIQGVVDLQRMSQRRWKRGQIVLLGAGSFALVAARAYVPARLLIELIRKYFGR